MRSGMGRFPSHTKTTHPDRDYVNLLEIPPMDDCDLVQIKVKFEHKLSLMGDTHSTQVKLQGNLCDVCREASKAILTAGHNSEVVTLYP